MKRAQKAVEHLVPQWGQAIGVFTAKMPPDSFARQPGMGDADRRTDLNGREMWPVELRCSTRVAGDRDCLAYIWADGHVEFSGRAKLGQSNPPGAPGPIVELRREEPTCSQDAMEALVFAVAAALKDRNLM